ncbi:MAG: aspartyl protease family protein [Bacteroidia bacterium]
MMGLTYAKVELINQYDENKFDEGLIMENQIRKMELELMVDTGAIRLVINEQIRDRLGLKKGFLMNASFADGTVKPVELVAGVKVKFGDRTCYTDAFVLPGDAEPLLGAIPLEGMDLAIIPSENKLAYNPKHPDGAVFSLK